MKNVTATAELFATYQQAQARATNLYNLTYAADLAAGRAPSFEDAFVSMAFELAEKAGDAYAQSVVPATLADLQAAYKAATTRTEQDNLLAQMANHADHPRNREMAQTTIAPKSEAADYGWDQSAVSADLLAEIEVALLELTNRFGVRVELTKHTVGDNYTLSCAGNRSGDIAQWLDMRGAYVVGANEYNRSDDFTAVYFKLA